MLNLIKNIKGDAFIKYGILIYILGFIFLFFVGQSYTGFFSFIAPFSIVFGAIVISIGLAK